MPDFTDMLSKAKEMQAKMKDAQDAIKNIEVEGVAGGNLVKVILTGDYEIKAIKLAPQSQAFKITDGICKDSISKTYFFRNPSSLEFRQDEQVTITINSASYEGQIKDCNEASLFVAISSESSNKIPEKIKIAYIKSDSSFLLIALKDIFCNIENKLSEN